MYMQRDSSRRTSHPRKNNAKACDLRVGPNLQVYGRLPWLADRLKRIARAFLLGNPLLFVGDDLEQEHFVLHGGHDFVEMRLVFLVAKRLSGLRVEFLTGKLPDGAVELDVRRVKLL